jgi:hypothetical protein
MLLGTKEKGAAAAESGVYCVFYLLETSSEQNSEALRYLTIADPAFERRIHNPAQIASDLLFGPGEISTDCNAYILLLSYFLYG